MRLKLPPAQLLAFHIAAEGLPDPVREFRFAHPRRFRADFAWPDKKLLVEVEGATWAQGRHTRGQGYEDDCFKYNLAALLGYRVLRFTGGLIQKGIAIETIKEALK